jgi:hypothetical protein
MKFLLIATLLAACNSIAFDARHPIFGIRAGEAGVRQQGKVLDEEQQDKETHLRTLREAIERVEDRVQKAIQEEVDTLFHHDEEVGSEGPSKKDKVKEKARKAVERGAQKVKKATVEGKSFPHEEEGRLLHAIGTAEKAVIHAVEEEVGTLFHEFNHPHEDTETAQKAEKVVKAGVKRIKEKVHEEHKERVGWFPAEAGRTLEDLEIKFGL